MIRIARLDLERWGHFDGQAVAFGPDGALHVVFGANETGKSTARRAIAALLFGVPPRTRDTFGRPGADLRIGALLEVDGTPVEVIRRKGIKNTLLGADGQPLEPAVLQQALGGLTADVHAGLFEITHDALVDGGEELLAGRGAVGEALFAAAAGTSRLHALRKRLEAEADALFSPRPSKRELNLLLARHAEVLRTLRDVGLRPPRHEALQRELEELEARYARCGAALEATERERARLERLRGAQPLVGLRATRAAELQALGDVPTLGADAAARRAAVTERRETARARAAAAGRELERHRRRVAQLAVDDAVLAARDELEALQSSASAVTADAERGAELTAERASVSARLDDVVAALRPALRSDPAAAGAGPVDAGLRDRLEACVQARAGVAQAVDAARSAVAEARRGAERARADAERTPAAPDDRALAAALRGARQAGDVDGQLARARAQERAGRAAADHTAGGDAAALVAVPTPERETIERLLRGVLNAEQLRAALETEAAAISERVRTREAEREDLATEAAVLDASALSAARAARDASWARVRDALTTPVAPDDAERLAVEHEHTTTEADDIADERLRHAEDVTRLADIERDLVKLGRDARELALRREEHALVLERARAAWAAAWAPAGALAPPPEAVGGWLARREEATEQLVAAARASAEAEIAERLRAEHVGALRAALAATTGAAAPIEDAPLATLAELAEARLEELRGAAEQAARAAEAVARTAAALEDAEATLAQAERQLEQWTATWTELRDGCGLAPALAPDDAPGAVRRLEEAARHRARVDALSAELAAIDRRRDALAVAVARHVAALAADLADRPAPAAAQELHRRAAAAHAAAAERDELATTIAELEAEQADAQAIVAEAEEELAALRAAAGAPDDATLLEREQASVRAAELRAEIARLDGDVARAGGAPAAEVAAAVAGLDADEAAVRAGELEALGTRQRDERDEAGRALTRARDELARLERSEEAAQARQEAASLEAQIRAVAERYARARLAQRVLQDAIAAYRSTHEGPLLERANALFPLLTCERFARLEIDVDERDEDVLIAITADGSRRRVEELSNGAREQLFLALRLAAVERHVATGQPVPVLFDDVLLESDDERAERILIALAELAAQTQVIVLTHHRHLVQIARATLAPERLDVIELGSAAELEPPPIAIAAPAAALPVTPAIASTPTLAEELGAALADQIGEQTSLL